MASDRVARSSRFRPVGVLACFATGVTILCGAALAEDVVRPAAVTGVVATHDGTDVELSWNEVMLDAAGQSETVAQYNIYRGELPDFVPDKDGGSNRVGIAVSELFTDDGAASGPVDYFYLVSAVDTAGNESDTKPCVVVTPPTLSGSWTNSSIELDWTDAEPSSDVVAYRVYYGQAPGEYEFVDDVGLATTHSLTGLTFFVNWYISVTAVDGNGNESAFSNEHADAPRGIVRVQALDGDELCWGGDCPPAEGRVQRNGGFQILAPTQFPVGDWNSVTATFTLESRLCKPGAQGTTSKCLAGNPCPEPPCNGGYNPCGDPWDRIAQLFLVLDDCIETGGSCKTHNNLELMRAVTPFGTDAEPPDGTGVIPPRALTLDVTPFAPLLTGVKYVGAEIVHYTQGGHWVSAEFTFSKRPESASPKPPADGIQIVGYGGAPFTKQVTIPPEASEVKMRVFTTGHGGSLFCDGGTNDAEPCTINGSNAECPGGVCHPCDEFCHRTNQVLLDGTPIWQAVPWRSDCSPSSLPCFNWNACGYPSCTYPRAGWCPGYIACHKNPPCDQDIDVTTGVSPGTYDVDYNVTPKNGSWPVSVVMYWYE